MLQFELLRLFASSICDRVGSAFILDITEDSIAGDAIWGRGLLAECGGERSAVCFMLIFESTAEMQ
jgi:hypothetical protein